MEIWTLITGIIVIISIPLCGAILLLSGVAEHYARKVEDSLKIDPADTPAAIRPAFTLRAVAVVYIMMTSFGLYSLLQPDRYMVILGITVQTFALMMGLTTLVFTIRVVQIWKAKTAGTGAHPGLFRLSGPVR